MRRVWIALLVVLVAAGGLVLYARLGSRAGKEGLALRFLEAFWAGDEDDLRNLAAPMYHRGTLPHVRDQQREAYRELFGTVPPREVRILSLTPSEDHRRAQRAQIEIDFEEVRAQGEMVFEQYRSAWGVGSFEIRVPEGMKARPQWEQLDAMADIVHLLWDELDHAVVTDAFPPLHPLTPAGAREPLAEAVAELGPFILNDPPQVERDGEIRGRVVMDSKLERGSVQVVVKMLWQVWCWRIEAVEVQR